MIDSFFNIVMTKSIGISLLILILIVARPFVLNKLNARIAYRLWLMIPLFLLLPSDWVVWGQTNEQASSMTFFFGVSHFLSSLIPEKQVLNSSVKFIALNFWGIGVLVCLMVYINRYSKLIRSFAPFDYQLPDQFLSSQDKFNLGLISIVTSSLVEVPAVFGLFKTYLILPVNFSEHSTKKQLIILQHEAYHLGRRDHQINFIRLLLKSVFWFNPLVYWADKYFEADQEISCDLGVMQSTDQKDKKRYAEALLESASGINQSSLVSQWKYQSLIKERVKMLKNTNQKKWHSWFAVVFAAMSIWMTSHLVFANGEEIVDAIPDIIEPPRYPIKAAKEGIEGWVKFKFNLDNKGEPSNLQLVKSIPEGVFDEVATTAISLWKFKPKMVNGIAVEQQGMFYTLEFKLK